MPWRYPSDDRHVPKGGEFLSTVLDTGAKRALPHSGLDYSRGEGAPVYAIGPGTVIAQGTNAASGWGYYTYIDHGNLGDGRHAYSYYAHKAQLGPANGTRYAGGEQIGTIGRTGSGITGPHLHWGVAVCTPAAFAATVRPMGAAARALLVDPEAFVAARLLASNQRRVGVMEARRRVEPSTASEYDVGRNLPPGAVVSPSGFVRSELDGGTVDGSDVWLVIDDMFTHISAVDDRGLHDLRDLGVVAPPEPPAPPAPPEDPAPPAPSEPDHKDPPRHAPTGVAGWFTVVAALVAFAVGLLLEAIR